MVRLFICLVSLLIAYPCKTQDTEYARRIIKVMSSPEFKGRGYVHNGHRIAARFIAREFSHNGLHSLFDGRYFQSFPISINTFPSKMEVAIDGIRLEPGREYLVHPASASCKGNYTLYYIKKTELTAPDALVRIIGEARGKFIMIDARADSEPDMESLKKADEMVEIISFSKQVPSAGTVIVTDEKLTWSISRDRTAKPVLTVNSTKLGNKPAEINMNIKSSISNHQTSNVAGFIPGTSCPDSFIFIVAHYDHLGMMGKEVYFPGANDNASGVSMLLGLSKYFSTNPHRYSMVFVAMTAEESGLNGSRYFADHSPVDLKKVVFLLNFDLAGTGDKGIKVVNGSEYKDKFDLLVKLNSLSGYLKDVQVRGPACNSDHCVFHERGVPCFYIYTMGGSPSYHDIHDTPDKLPLAEFAGYQELMIDFLKNLNNENE